MAAEDNERLESEKLTVVRIWQAVLDVRNHLSLNSMNQNKGFHIIQLYYERETS